MNSYAGTFEEFDDSGDETRRGIISADTLVAYLVAFILDMGGLLCFLLSLTVVLFPLGVAIQFMLNLFGKIFFTIWIVFFRGDISSGVKMAARKSAPLNSSKSKTVDSPDSSSTTSSFDKQAAENLGQALGGSGSNKVVSIFKKWILRVLIPWLIESVPILGKIALSWIVSVYLETKND